MKSISYSKELKVAQAIALKAGKIMLKYFDGGQEVKTKADNTVVTIADTSINELVIKELSKKFPKDGIIGEEKSTTEYGAGRKWFCDPIDGTNAYTWGVPTAMFSLGLIVDGKPVLGVAYDPFLKRMYYAVQGQGAYCNRSKLRVSQDNLNGSLVAISSSLKNILTLPYLETLKREGVRFAVFSGAVYKMCLLARGRFVAYIEEGVNPHDMAAVQIIVEEAGGLVTGINGETLDYRTRFKGAVVTNKKVHDKVIELIKPK